MIDAQNILAVIVAIAIVRFVFRSEQRRARRPVATPRRWTSIDDYAAENAEQDA